MNSRISAILEELALSLLREADSSCEGGRTDPALWKKSKARAIRKLGGRFSARAMQLAGRYYRDEGGGYCGSKTKAQKSMEKWTKEDWKTAPGALKKACKLDPDTGEVTCDRYLPAAAWKKLTPAQRKATRRKKLKATGQWVPNTAKAARASERIRSKLAAQRANRRAKK